MSSHLVWLQSQHVFMIIFTMLIWLSSDIYILVFCPLQHSLIAMSSSWIFWTKWMWSDPNLSMLSISNSICPNHMHLLKLSNVFSASLSAEDTETNIKSVLNDSSLLFEIRRSRNNHPTNLAGMGTWDNSEYVACLPRVPWMWTGRGTCVIALCRTPSYKYVSPAVKKTFFHLSTSSKP